MPMNNDQVPIQYQSSAPGGNPGHLIVGERGQCAVRNNGGSWEYNLWDNTGWHVCPDQAEYHVPFSCRGIFMHNIVDEAEETDATIEFDEIGYGASWGSNATRFQKNIINTLPTRQRIQCCLHSVYLTGSTSTFTEIYFSA